MKKIGREKCDVEVHGDPGESEIRRQNGGLQASVGAFRFLRPCFGARRNS